MIKIVSLFLIAMLALALFGRLRLPGRGRSGGRQTRNGRCALCGRPRIGRGPCPCDRGNRG